MNANEDGIVLRVFDRYTLLEWNKNVARPRHHDFQIGLAQFARKTFRDVEGRDFLRAAKLPVGPVVFAAVSSIDDNSAKRFAGVFSTRFRRSPPGSTSGEQARKSEK
jgi:hypothetical protein